MEIEKSIPLIIDQTDLPQPTRDEVNNLSLLGGEKQVPKAIYDMLPRIIAQRIEDIVPENFELAELEFKFTVDGKFFGAGVGGEVVATLKRKGAKES